VCSWDGEEVGLTGSTEWGEQFADELKEKGVAYINVDSSTSGPNFHPSAVASLAPLIVEVSKSLTAPSGKSLHEEWKLSMRREKKRPVTDRDLVDTRIGSGSDHTVFLNHVGMPTVGLQFDGPYGVYHSMYDNFYWMNQFGDPGYRYHTLCAQVWGVLALRLANADVLPFDFAFYADNIRQFVAELRKNNRAASGLDFAGLDKSLGAFESAGKLLDREIGRVSFRRQAVVDDGRLTRLLMMVERNWLSAEGIPGRPWFKHILYAARYTYAHLELPGLTEAIEKGDWKVAAGQIRILERALSENALLLRAARERLRESAARRR
jgi:N-acetylated-alpha-linked acidic dipeptidase